MRRPYCSECDSISLQWVTTQSHLCDVEFVERVPGKKPYKVRCKKCGRMWKTNAEYARVLSGEAFQTQKRAP